MDILDEIQQRLEKFADELNNGKRNIRKKYNISREAESSIIIIRGKKIVGGVYITKDKRLVYYPEFNGHKMPRKDKYKVRKIIERFISQ